MIIQKTVRVYIAGYLANNQGCVVSSHHFMSKSCLFSHQVDAVLSMVASIICDQSDQPLVEPDPEDLAEEQGLLAR